MSRCTGPPHKLFPFTHFPILTTLWHEHCQRNVLFYMFVPYCMYSFVCFSSFFKPGVLNSLKILPVCFNNFPVKTCFSQPNSHLLGRLNQLGGMCLMWLCVIERDHDSLTFCSHSDCELFVQSWNVLIGWGGSLTLVKVVLAFERCTNKNSKSEWHSFNCVTKIIIMNTWYLILKYSYS